MVHVTKTTGLYPVYWYVTVIPLKITYYRDFCQTWHNWYSCTEHWKSAIKRWGHRACFRAAFIFFLFFTELREKRSKLDRAEKMFLNSKSNWILLKTWAYLFFRAKIFQQSDFKLLDLAKKFGRKLDRYIKLTVWLQMQFHIILYK